VPSPTRPSRDGDNDSTHETAASRIPAIHSFIPASRIKKSDKDKESGWRRFLRVGTSSSNTSSHAEEGRRSGEYERDEEKETGFLRVPTHRSMMRAPTIEPEEGNDRGLKLTHTLSRAISFHPDTAVSSETAPNMQNYGSANPTFKRNPGLSMFRTTSIKPEGEDDGPSVSFRD
jgi:hypothetical protein